MSAAARKTRVLVATLAVLIAAFLCRGDDKPTVRVLPMDSVGPRPVEEQTRAGVVRDYLKAWESLDDAFSANRPEILDAYFVGLAKDRLAGAIREQRTLGIETVYKDQSHNIQATFYSPEGLSIQLLDDVDYDVEVSDKGKQIGTQHIKARYVAVLTPTESKWKVRVFQGRSQSQQTRVSASPNPGARK